MNKHQILSTKEYEIFQSYERNRKILKKHVATLVKDSTFPEKFCTCPIIVNEDFFVIDGQHRLAAAKQLKIPVFYIIDPVATEEDIKKRNVQMKRWTTNDFLRFHEGNNASVRLIIELRNMHKVGISLITEAVAGLLGVQRRYLHLQIRDGSVNFSEIFETVKDFCNIYFTAIKRIKLIKGDASKPLYTDCFVYTAAKLFISDSKTLIKSLKKMEICDYPIPYSRRNSDCEYYFEKVSRWLKSNAQRKVVDYEDDVEISM